MVMVRNLVKKIYYYVQFAVRYLLYNNRFRHIGIHSIVKRPIRILGGKKILIGDYVIILDGLRIEALTRYNQQRFSPELVIEDGVRIGQNVHIVCAERVILHKDVSVGPYTMINDSKHGYNRPDLPLYQQDIQTKPIEIGEGTIIGMGVCILPGVTIGRHCFIGANTVVSKNIPDNSIVAAQRPRVVQIPYE